MRNHLSLFLFRGRLFALGCATSCAFGGQPSWPRTRPDIIASTGCGVHVGQSVLKAVLAHIPLMESFHRRYRVSTKILRFWAQMVRGLDIEQIVPQHGRRFFGKAMYGKFIDWLETLDCGIDLMSQSCYIVP